MTRLTRAVEEAIKTLKPALDDARKRKEENREFFKSVAAAFAELYRAVGFMVAYGEIDPTSYDRIESEIFREISQAE